VDTQHLPRAKHFPGLNLSFVFRPFFLGTCGALRALAEKQRAFQYRNKPFAFAAAANIMPFPIPFCVPFDYRPKSKPVPLTKGFRFDFAHVVKTSDGLPLDYILA
jgi:hypothetical protein